MALFQPQKAASSRWSDTSSTVAVAPLSRRSIKDEVSAVADILSEERSKNSVTIGIVREEGVKRLEKACAYSRKWFERGAPPMLFTTAEGLQNTIDTMKLSPKQRTLNLLASPDTPEIAFHVPHHFTELKVLRCAKHRDGGTLFVDGASTYNGVRLDKWQAHHHKNHALLIGYKRGVRIRLPDVVSLPHWSRCRSQFSEGEQAELRQHFGMLGGKSRWEDVKGAVAAIMGLIGGSVKLSAGLNASANGVYAKYTFGLHAIEIGAAGASVSAVATAAGPAVVLGVASAVAVYFIPWESLFEWLKGALSCIWDKICALWQQFKDWVVNFFSAPSEAETKMDLYPRPMRFSG